MSHPSVLRVAAAFLAFALLLQMPSARAAQGDNITVGVGAQRVLPMPGVTKASIGDPMVAEVKPAGGSSLLLTGVSEGRTTLTVFKGGKAATYVILVRKQDPEEEVQEIRKLLGDIEGITVRPSADRIYLEGQAYTAQDAERVDQIVSMFPNVKSLVRVAANAKKLVTQNLNANFQRAGLRNVQATVVGSTIFLEGSVESPEDLKKAELIVKALNEKVENLLVVGLKKMILSEVQFVEIRRTVTDRVGIKYPLDITGTVVYNISGARSLAPAAPSTLTSAFGMLPPGAQAAFALGFQLNDGYARLLAQPHLVCASGEKAEFLAGGQVPIPLITNNQFTVEYKPYGIILNLKPTADRNGNIQTEIEAEASEVDNSVQVAVGGNGNVPGFRTRKVKTNVTVRHGETIMLSGVFTADEQKAVSKVPGLGHIPIIGEFFKNRSFDTTKRELIIFVTPRIVTPDSDQVRQRIEDMKARYRQAKGEVQFSIFD